MSVLFALLVQVVARDDDQGLNSKLSYVLVAGNEEGAFTLSDSGELRLVRSLDREAKEQYLLLVTAADAGEAAAGRASLLLRVCEKYHIPGRK